MNRHNIKKDTITKLYWEEPAEFADLFNAIYFGGEEVLGPEELREQDSDIPLFETGESHLETTNQTRDLLKLADHMWNKGAMLLLVGFENQTQIHYAMPLRIMGYEYRNYRKQYEEKVRKHKREGYQGMDSAEMLSGLRKTERLIPVVTIVLYYGSEPWDGPGNLHGMLDIPEEMQEFVADYPMHLVEVREANLPVRTKRNKDFFHLTKILLDESRSVEQRLEEATEYEKNNDVDSLVGVTASVMFAGGKLKVQQGQEGMKMIQIFEYAKEEGKQEGMREGMQAGKYQGEATIIYSMYKNGFSAEQIASATDKDVEEIRTVITKHENVPV